MGLWPQDNEDLHGRRLCPLTLLVLASDLSDSHSTSEDH